ncbi:phosphoadenylyl-sulfate reductase [Actinoalloteichus caeruleus]|uniref:Adenosine 5'-phosphosulfate reductase n=2 Tax=Actinoalloteichus cyanogriseus TaxID=2893586 RepID=A0ABT1JNZ0_ACTCY|nr:phosphoadenylyl-sulfate reductase [Actinoalloteichus caeruleus]MCP2334240.1 phosphoadenosine phosphosulfate reductase [Actinoalloteichus caeruleus DSM 43889]
MSATRPRANGAGPAPDNTDARRAESRALAEHGARELAGADAATVLAWTARTFGDDWIVASNMQDAVLVHLASRARPGVAVLFLDTGYHFAETIGTRDAVATTYPVRVVDVVPERTVSEQDAIEGPDLFARDPDRCCALRKVAPLRRTLSGYRAWVTGVRRVEAPTRADTPLVTFDERHGLVKVNPLAFWSDEDMADYAAEHQVLVNPLVAAGYPSIGCRPCTSRPAPGSDPRSGRWAGLRKTECGLHG